MKISFQGFNSNMSFDTSSKHAPKIKAEETAKKSEKIKTHFRRKISILIFSIIFHVGQFRAMYQRKDQFCRKCVRTTQKRPEVDIAKLIVFLTIFGVDFKIQRPHKNRTATLKSMTTS